MSPFAAVGRFLRMIEKYNSAPRDTSDDGQFALRSRLINELPGIKNALCQIGKQKPGKAVIEKLLNCLSGVAASGDQAADEWGPLGKIYISEPLGPVHETNRASRVRSHLILGATPRRIPPSFIANLERLVDPTTWKPPRNYLSKKDIEHEKRFQKAGKNPTGSVIQRWVEFNPTPVIRHPKANATYYPLEWVMARWKKWKPQKRDRNA